MTKLRRLRGCLRQFKETKLRIETTNIGTADEKGYNDDFGLRVVPAMLANATSAKLKGERIFYNFGTVRLAISELRIGAFYYHATQPRCVCQACGPSFHSLGRGQG